MANGRYNAMPDDGLLLVHSTATLTQSDDKQGGITVTLNYGESVPSYLPFDPYQAYLVRITSFANGAIYAIEHSGDDETLKAAKIKAVEKLLKRKTKELENFKQATQGRPVVFGPELYQFYNKDLPAASGLEPKQIALAEAFYVWQVVPSKTRVTKYTKQLPNNLRVEVEQIDTTRNAPLTDAQKQELRRIHNPENLPKWFKDLAPWAQNALKNIVHENDDKWEKYEKCRPAILRHIPGEANATQHELQLTLKGIYDIPISSTCTVAYRQGTPTSFNMKDAGERQASANQNLAQMITAVIKNLQKDSAESFEKNWGFAPSKKIKCPILLVGLLSPRSQTNNGFESTLLRIGDALGFTGDENNTQLVLEKDIAYGRLKKDDLFEVFNLNVPVNKHRALVEPDAGFIQFTKDFHATVEAEVKLQPDSDEKAHRLARLAQLEKANSILESLGAKPEPEGRNRNLYLAAMYDVTARLMGASVGNCKSSKDRKGVELMIADAMLIYFAIYGEFPKFDDQPDNRKNFIQIFCDLYVSGHQLLIAHDNSPGCVGIKDEGILDKDIKEALEKMIRCPNQEPKNDGIVADRNDEKAPLLPSSGGSAEQGDPKAVRSEPIGAYTQSREIAEFNKPGTFWQKYKKKIGYGILALSVLLMGISAALIATGVLSPLGVLGAVAGAKAATVGLSAVAVGGAVTTATFGGSALVVGGAAYQYQSRKQKAYDESNTFIAQENRIPPKGINPPAPSIPVVGASSLVLIRSALEASVPGSALVPTAGTSSLATSPSRRVTWLLTPSSSVDSGNAVPDEKAHIPKKNNPEVF